MVLRDRLHLEGVLLGVVGREEEEVRMMKRVTSKIRSRLRRWH